MIASQLCRSASSVLLPIRWNSLLDGPMENELGWLAAPDNRRLPALGDTQLPTGGLGSNTQCELIHGHAVFRRSDTGLMKWKACKKTA
jgi:hypothetical protein